MFLIFIQFIGKKTSNNMVKEGKIRMEEHVLVNNSEKYNGQYVATKSFSDKNVLNYGDDPIEVFNQAKENGVDEPVVFYVPKKGLINAHKQHPFYIDKT